MARNPESAGILEAPKETTSPFVPAKDVPLILVTVTALLPEVVASPLNSELVHVCVEPAKRQIPAPGETAKTSFAGFTENLEYVRASVPTVVTVEVKSQDVSAFTVPLCTGIAPVELILLGVL